MTEQEVYNELAMKKDRYIKMAGFDEFGISPSRIFHYTGPAGFKGIVENGCIRASNAMYLNDSSEVNYGRQLVVNELERLTHNHSLEGSSKWYKIDDGWTADRETTTKYDILVQTLRQMRGRFEFDHYVASFCLIDNLLSQWRAYGKDGGGFSLGFDVARNTYSAAKGKEFWCFPILYDQDKQVEIVLGFIDAVLESLVGAIPLIEKYPNWQHYNPITRQHGQVLINGLAMICLCFKDPGYAVEKEWRICTAAEQSDIDHTEFREGKGLLIPYVEIPIDNVQLTLQSVMCGPGPDSELSLASASMFLKKKDFAYVIAKRSEIPLKP